MTDVTSLELGLVYNGQRRSVAKWTELLKAGANGPHLKEEFSKELDTMCTTLSLKVYDQTIIKEGSSGFGAFELLIHQLIGVNRKLMRAELSFIRGTSDDSENSFYLFEPRPPRDVVRISKFCFMENVSYAIKEEDGLVSSFLEKYVADSRKIFSAIELPPKDGDKLAAPKLMEVPLLMLAEQIRQQVTSGYEVMKIVYGPLKPRYETPPLTSLEDIWG